MNKKLSDGYKKKPSNSGKITNEARYLKLKKIFVKDNFIWHITSESAKKGIFIRWENNKNPNIKYGYAPIILKEIISFKNNVRMKREILDLTKKQLFITEKNLIKALENEKK